MARARPRPDAARDDGPLLRLCVLWHRRRLALEVCGADDGLIDRRNEQLVRTERQIAETPAGTPAGLFAKLAIYEHSLFMVMDAENPDCAEQLALSLIGDVRRLLR